MIRQSLVYSNTVPDLDNLVLSPNIFYISKASCFLWISFWKEFLLVITGILPSIMNLKGCAYLLKIILGGCIKFLSCLMEQFGFMVFIFPPFSFFYHYSFPRLFLCTGWVFCSFLLSLAGLTPGHPSDCSTAAQTEWVCTSHSYPSPVLQ